jgi:NAD-dependent SIR2 family protein deacetylase
MYGRVALAHRIAQALHERAPPRDIFVDQLGFEPTSESGTPLTDEEAQELLVNILERITAQLPRPRTYCQSMADVITLFANSQRIVVIIGAGASVGPDFRSPGGLYDTIASSGALPDPYLVFDSNYFAQDPTVFWRFAHMIFPSVDPEHSAAQLFLAKLAGQNRLQRLYSQNVDALEVGIPDDKLRCVHGSWRENRCTMCGVRHGIEDLRDCVNREAVPVCRSCGGSIQPGIVFFGQRTKIEDEDFEADAQAADLLLVIGTSLRVAPVSYLPHLMPGVPSILINREPVTCEFNAELLGDCDEVCRIVERELGWREDGENADRFRFSEPNRFVLPSDLGTTFVETGRDLFVVTPMLAGTQDDDFD